MANHDQLHLIEHIPIMIKQPSGSIQSYKHKISETPNSNEHETTPDNVPNIELSNGDAVKQCTDKMSADSLKLNQWMQYKNSMNRN